MRSEKIGLRLNSKELQKVRKHAGATDSERVRSIINDRSMGDTIAQSLNERIDEVDDKLNKIISEIDRVKEHEESTGRKLAGLEETLGDVGQSVAAIYKQVAENAGEIGKARESLTTAVNNSHWGWQETRAIRGKQSEADPPPKKGLFG